MVGRIGTTYRSVFAALAAMIAAATPSIAWAGDGNDTTGGAKDTVAEHQAETKADAKSEPKKPAKKVHAKKATHKAAPAVPSDKPAKAKPVKRIKKTAARAVNKKAAPKKGEGAKAPPTSARGSAAAKPCFGPPVTIDRVGTEAETLSLVTCSGTPIEASRAHLSALARPWGAVRPDLAPGVARHGRGLGSAPPVHLLDRGLALRLDAIARHYPGHPLSVVSGWRPTSRGSLHQSGRAIDLRVTGVTNAELDGFCRSLQDTGCGFYPNSSFVHVDVRQKGTGSVSWIDASGAGEMPRYVSAWPPREDGPAASADEEAPEPADEPHGEAGSDATYDDDATSAAKRQPHANGRSMGVAPEVSSARLAPSLLR